jgi:hypothetical protein
MPQLFQALSQRVDGWRSAGHPCAEHPAIREVLEFAVEDADTNQLRFVRRAQLRALETYWYLRVVNTPTAPDLYAALFPKPKRRSWPTCACRPSPRCRIWRCSPTRPTTPRNGRPLLQGRRHR